MDDVTDNTQPKPGLTVPTQINLTLNIKSPNMDYYLLTDDRLESLQGGAESLDLTFAGAGFAVFLTLVGLAIPMYAANQTGRIFLAACLISPIFLFISLYLGWRGLDARRKCQKKLNDLKRESATVVTISPAKPLSPE